MTGFNSWTRIERFLLPPAQTNLLRPALSRAVRVCLLLSFAVLFLLLVRLFVSSFFCFLFLFLLRSTHLQNFSRQYFMPPKLSWAQLAPLPVPHSLSACALSLSWAGRTKQFPPLAHTHTRAREFCGERAREREVAKWLHYKFQFCFIIIFTLPLFRSLSLSLFHCACVCFCFHLSLQFYLCYYCYFASQEAKTKNKNI